MTPAPPDLAERIDSNTVTDLLAGLLRRDLDLEWAMANDELRWEVEAPGSNGLVPVVVRRRSDGLVFRARWHWSQLVAS